jgi:hypothetical protein
MRTRELASVTRLRSSSVGQSQLADISPAISSTAAAALSSAPAL